MQEQEIDLPPGVAPTEHIVLFDGICKLCSAWARFLIRFDHNHRFKLATVQSPEGQAILAWFGLPTDHYETMLLVVGPRCYTKSSAFIRILRKLPFPWSLACVVWIVPRFIRDWVYDRIAFNRYSLFGKYESCLLPTPDHASRFLNAK